VVLLALVVVTENIPTYRNRKEVFATLCKQTNHRVQLGQMLELSILGLLAVLELGGCVG
jgi:hypothetical protein